MIGIFDSGIGGLSLYKKAKEQFPRKGFIYLSDKANFPYGKKESKEIVALAQRNTQILIDHGAEVVLVACNTATVSAVPSLRASFTVPIVGVEPASKVLIDNNQTENSVVWGTSRTISVKKTDLNKTLYLTNDELVTHIENDFPTLERLKQLTESKIPPGTMRVVLGCTHFNLIREVLEDMYPEINFIVPEDAIINQLGKHNSVARDGDDIFLTTSDPAGFSQQLEMIIGKKVNVRRV